MRDVARIDRIIEKLRLVWKILPDWRLLQLTVNLADKFNAEAFHVEDDLLEKELDVLIAENELNSCSYCSAPRNREDEQCGICGFEMYSQEIECVRCGTMNEPDKIEE